MLGVTCKKRPDGKFIPVQNGIETKWLPLHKGGSHEQRVKDRPFRDWNGDVLTFDCEMECKSWCIAYFHIQRTSMI